MKNQIRTVGKQGFTLEKTQLTENHFWRPYFMRRTVVAQAMKQPIGRVIYRKYHFNVLGVTYSLQGRTVRGSDRITIGCKIFAGKSYLKLRGWALRKKN